MPEKIQTVLISVFSIVFMQIIDEIEVVSQVLQIVFNSVIAVLTIVYLIFKIGNEHGKTNKKTIIKGAENGKKN